MRQQETERLEKRAKEDGDYEALNGSKKSKKKKGVDPLDLTGEKTIDNSALMQQSMLGYQAQPSPMMLGNQQQQMQAPIDVSTMQQQQ